MRRSSRVACVTAREWRPPLSAPLEPSPEARLAAAPGPTCRWRPRPEPLQARQRARECEPGSRAAWLAQPAPRPLCCCAALFPDLPKRASRPAGAPSPRKVLATLSPRALRSYPPSSKKTSRPPHSSSASALSRAPRALYVALRNCRPARCHRGQGGEKREMRRLSVSAGRPAARLPARRACVHARHRCSVRAPARARLPGGPASGRRSRQRQ